MSSPFNHHEPQQGKDGPRSNVRPKKQENLQLPSFKAILIQAIHDVWYGYPAAWKEWRKQHKEKKLRAKKAKAFQRDAAAAQAAEKNRLPNTQWIPLNPLHLPDRPPTPHPLASISAIQLYQPHPPGVEPLIMSNNQPSQPDGSNKQPRGILKTDSQRFQNHSPNFPPMHGTPPQPQMPTAPMPQGYYPTHPGYPPQAGYATMIPQSGYATPTPYHNPTPNPYQSQVQLQQPPYQVGVPPGPTQPPAGWPLQNLPPGARAVSPPRFPTAEDFKHKCGNCNRTRSASYHFKNPVLPGQIPPKTVCRRCRSTPSDSDGDSTEDGRVYRSRSHRSRSRRRSSVSERSARRVESVGHYLGRRTTSRGRSYSRDYDTYYDDENRRIRAASRSTSVESVIRAPSRASSRAAVTSRSIVRHVHEPAEEEIVVVHRPRRIRRIVYVDEIGSHDDSHSSSHGTEQTHRSSRRYVRDPTPAPRHLDPRQRSDPGIASPEIVERTNYFEDPVPRRSFSKCAASPWPHDTYQTEHEDDWYANASARRSGRSRDRHHGYYRGSDRSATPTSYRYVSRDQEATAQGGRIVTGSSASAQPIRRSRSRSRSVHAPAPEDPRRDYDSGSTSDDYLTTDKDGMRIRVREI